LKRLRVILLLAILLAACRARVEQAPDRSPRKVGGLDPVKIVAMLKDTDDERDVQKRYAAVVAGAMREQSAIDLLNAMVIREKSPAVRQACAWALGEMADATSISPLTQALRDRDPAVRSAAVDALGRYDDPDVMNLIKGVAEGPEGALALTAMQALASADSPQRRAMLADADPGKPDRFTAAGEPYKTVRGKTWYVDASAGNDLAAGTEAAPFKTLARAIQEIKAGAGDAILATSGANDAPFRESLVFGPDKSGARNGMTLLGAWPGKPTPILDGATPTSPDKPSLERGISITGSFVRIDGFTVRRFQDSGIDLDGAVSCVVSNCTVENCDRHGIFLYYSADSAVINPRVSRCNFQGISIRSSARPAVLGGTSDHNGIDGLLFLWGTEDALVDGFSATGNRRGISFIRGSHNGRVFRSKLEGNSEFDLVVEPDSSAQAVDTRVGRAQ
jgi:parallel beta-helix repeat protein